MERGVISMLLEQARQGGQWEKPHGKPPKSWECRTELQAIQLRLLLAFLLHDRLAVDCQCVVEWGRIPEMISVWIRELGQHRLFGGGSGEIVAHNARIWNDPGLGGAVEHIREEGGLYYGVADANIFVEVGWPAPSLVDVVSFQTAGGFDGHRGGYRLSFDGVVYGEWQAVATEERTPTVVNISLSTPVKTMKIEGRGDNWAKIRSVAVDGRTPS